MALASGSVTAAQINSSSSLLSGTSSSSNPITVSGVVLNASSGLPISRALVRLEDRMMFTDHEGKFEFPQFTPPNWASLEVRKPGFYFTREMGVNMITLRSEQLNVPITVRMYPEALITGTLTDSDGTPLPQVFVMAMRSTYSDVGQQWFPAAQHLTNSRGEFRLPVPPGDYRIETNFSPRIRNSSNAILPLVYPIPGTTGTIDGLHMRSGTEEHFDLHPIVSRTYMVSLRLDPPQERGFPMLMARAADGTMLPVSMLRSGPAGGDEMRAALPSGTFTLIASMNNGENAEYGETTVTVTDHDLSGVSLRMSSVAPIPVQVVLDSDASADKTPPKPQQLGLILENAQKSFSRFGGFSSAVMATAGNGGTYMRPMPGVYRLMARNSDPWYVKSATYGTADLLQQEMTVAASAGSSPIIVTVSDQTGSLQGSVRRSGTPVSAWVEVIPTGHSAVPVYTTRSGADGSFNFASLPPGSYQAIAFDSHLQADFRNSSTLAPFTTYVHSVSVTHSNKASVDLDVVPDAELTP
jgi:hypothetical protein